MGEAVGDAGPRGDHRGAARSTIADEYGGQIDVNYSAPACDWAALPTPQTNTTHCFPQYIGGSSMEDPERHWFNKYVVTSVTGTDRTGGAPDQVTRYGYLGGAAWHYEDDDGLTKEKSKTWSQWRGFGHMRVKTGGQGGDTAVKSQSDSYFLRGMDGERESPTGGTKNVSITLGEGEGDPITDHEALAGTTYRTVGYSGNGGKVLTKTVNRPWYHRTAMKTRDRGTVTANFTGARTAVPPPTAPRAPASSRGRPRPHHRRRPGARPRPWSATPPTTCAAGCR